MAKLVIRIRCRKCNAVTPIISADIDPTNEDDWKDVDAQIDGDAKYPAPCQCGFNNIWNEVLLDDQIMNETRWTDSEKMRADNQKGGGNSNDLPTFTDPENN